MSRSSGWPATHRRRTWRARLADFYAHLPGHRGARRLRGPRRRLLRAGLAAVRAGAVGRGSCSPPSTVSAWRRSSTSSLRRPGGGGLRRHDRARGGVARQLPAQVGGDPCLPRRAWRGELRPVGHRDRRHRAVQGGLRRRQVRATSERATGRCALRVDALLRVALPAYGMAQRAAASARRTAASWPAMTDDAPMTAEAARGVRLVAAQAADRPRWDAFVRGARRRRDPLQTWAWGECAALAGEPPVRILAETADGRVRGVAQALVRPAGIGRSVGYVAHGPIWEREAADARPPARRAPRRPPPGRPGRARHRRQARPARHRRRRRRHRVAASRALRAAPDR